MILVFELGASIGVSEGLLVGGFRAPHLCPYWGYN